MAWRDTQIPYCGKANLHAKPVDENESGAVRIVSLNAPAWIYMQIRRGEEH